MTTNPIPSLIGRLLAEVSWDGALVSRYRDGGRGYENVLTTECLQALDLLPRTHFLGAILNDVTTGAKETISVLRDEIETASIDLLPGNKHLKPSGDRHQTKIAVQPDGIIESNRVFCLIEAKRITGGIFQPQQLTKEYLLVTRDAQQRAPLLLLILGKAPPVKIQNHGKMAVNDAIRLHIDKVYEEMDDHPHSLDDLRQRVDKVVSWTTWRVLADSVGKQLRTFSCESESISRSIRRLADSVTNSVKWHETHAQPAPSPYSSPAAGSESGEA